METSRDDVGIAIRSALIDRGTKQKFSLIVLIIVSIILIYLESVKAKPLNLIRSFFKDTIYRGAVVVTAPSRGLGSMGVFVKDHINLYNNYNKLKKENWRYKPIQAQIKIAK